MADRAQKNLNREERRRRMFEALEEARAAARAQADALLRQERNALATHERGRQEDDERRRRDLDEARRTAEGLRRDIEGQRTAHTHKHTHTGARVSVVAVVDLSLFQSSSHENVKKYVIHQLVVKHFVVSIVASVQRCERTVIVNYNW